MLRWKPSKRWVVENTEDYKAKFTRWTFQKLLDKWLVPISLSLFIPSQRSRGKPAQSLLDIKDMYSLLSFVTDISLISNLWVTNALSARTHSPLPAGERTREDERLVATIVTKRKEKKMALSGSRICSFAEKCWNFNARRNGKVILELLFFAIENIYATNQSSNSVHQTFNYACNGLLAQLVNQKRESSEQDIGFFLLETFFFSFLFPTTNEVMFACIKGKHWLLGTGSCNKEQTNDVYSNGSHALISVGRLATIQSIRQLASSASSLCRQLSFGNWSLCSIGANEMEWLPERSKGSIERERDHTTEEAKGVFLTSHPEYSDHNQSKPSLLVAFNFNQKILQKSNKTDWQKTDWKWWSKPL